MYHRTRRPAEPPLTGYTRRTAPPSYRRPAIASIAAVVAMTAVAVVVVLLTDNAARAADNAPVASATPTPPEYAPPVPATIPGDGMFLVGKHVKPGVYRSTAGRSCYWERLAGLSGSYVDLIANGGLRKGPHLIEIKASDYAFSSQNCGGGWVMMS